MDSSIPRHARDVIQKLLADLFKDGLAQWLGVPELRIESRLPAEVSTLAFNNQVLDHVFLTHTDCLFHLEFQSDKERQLYRFLTYAAALVTAHHKPVETMVLYLYQEPNAPDYLDLHSLLFTVDNVFVAKMPGDTVWERLVRLPGDRWTDADFLDLAFYPFMRSEFSLLERAIRAAKLANLLPTPGSEIAGAAVVGLTCSFVDPEVVNLIQGVIRVNDLITALENDAIERGWAKGMQQGMQEGIRRDRVHVIMVLTDNRIGEIPDPLAKHIAGLDADKWCVVIRQLATVTSLDELRRLVTL